MTADIIPLPSKLRPVKIERGDRVEHRESGKQGFAFKVDGRRITVSRNGERIVGDIGEWRPV